jgi:VIT1/CCC1 family predicted Fe2+/Mn2+ transporter
MTTEAAEKSQKRVLDPVERLSEILFGLIMVLTFTGSFSVATADRAETRAMLIGAIGCNIAWGLIDAIMYLMHSLNRRGIERQTVLTIRTARTREHAHAVIRENVPQPVAEELHPDLLDRIRNRVAEMPLAVHKPRLGSEDFRGALAVFLIVVASTVPVIVPFVFLQDLTAAMRISNLIAVAMLAVIGFAYGRASGLSPWWTSASMVLIGGVLVAITIALGG